MILLVHIFPCFYVLDMCCSWTPFTVSGLAVNFLLLFSLLLWVSTKLLRCVLLDEVVSHEMLDR